MGAAGAGLATFLANCAACVYFFIFLFVKRKSTYVCIRPSMFRFKKNIIFGICAVGIPASIQNLLNVTGMTILNNFTASFGSDAVAAMGISQKMCIRDRSLADILCNIINTQALFIFFTRAIFQCNFHRLVSPIFCRSIFYISSRFRTDTDHSDILWLLLLQFLIFSVLYITVLIFPLKKSLSIAEVRITRCV